MKRKLLDRHEMQSRASWVQSRASWGPNSRVENADGTYEFKENWYEGMTENEMHEYYENEMSNEKQAKDRAKAAAKPLEK